MASRKARELRALLGAAVQLRTLAQTSGDPDGAEHFLAAAMALESRAHQLAFGPVSVPPAVAIEKVNLVC